VVELSSSLAGNICAVNVSDFDFELPPGSIAQEASAERSDSRLLHLDRSTGVVTHGAIRDLPNWLNGGDVVVVNNTRVFPARLIGRRSPSGGAVECLLIERVGAEESGGEVWDALMHPGQKLKPGALVIFEGSGKVLHGEVQEQRFFGRRTVRLWTDDETAVERAIDALGHVPLPPYIRRGDRDDDRERYQTVYAAVRGSVAAPTAGLHLSRDLIAQLRDTGVQIAEITMHVGYGTFQPVRVDQVEDHTVHSETYEVPEQAAAMIDSARRDGRRVIAVGTTTTRTLEAVARDHHGRIVPASGRTDLFIYPGFEFQVINGLLTNFHLPRSSLLMLVSAFAGRAHVLDAYSEAIAAGYRFYSYGDAMLIT
jgi:S-adenosylmethionine:tRNA ribosyltransferase-isomerase